MRRRTARVLVAVALLGVASLSTQLGAGATPAAEAPTPVAITVGKSPLSIAVDSSTDMVYVANSGSQLSSPGTVSVIDGHEKIGGKANTGTVVTTIGVGHDPWGIAVDSSADKIYVANRGSSNVSVIDGKTNKVVDTVAVGSRPIGIGVVPATHKIYVANNGAGNTAGSVSVIDGKTDKVVGTIPVGYGPFGIGVNTKTQTVYVGNTGGAGSSTNFAGTVSVVRGMSVVGTVTIGGSPAGIGVDEATNTTYVANSSIDFGSQVAVLNSVNRLVAQSPLPDPDVQGVAVDTGNHAVFVGEPNSGRVGGPVGDVTVINAKTNGAIATVSLGANPWGVAVDSTTDRVYAANATSPGTVSMLDFSHYPINGGTKPKKITAPIETPTTATTTTTTPKTGAPPVNTPPPQTNNKASFCAALDKAGSANINIYARIGLGRSAVYAAGADGCTESTSLQAISFVRTPDEYTVNGSAPKSPTGLGAGAKFWVDGTPNNHGFFLTFRAGGTWVTVTDYFYGIVDEPSQVAGFLTFAQQLYAQLG